MPMASVRLIPGVDTEKTYALNEAGISTSAYIRFREGFVEKLGGWVRYVQFVLSGIPRALHAWQDLNDDGHLAVGTTVQLGVITDGAINDITPQQLVSDFTPDFTTTIGSAVVEIDDPNIDTVTTYDSVFLSTPVSIGGIVVSGLYPITLVTGTTTYQITARENATASESGAGAVPDFTTTSGSSAVIVDLDDHGLVAGDRFNANVSTSVGGVTIYGSYLVNVVNGPDQFVIAANTSATSSTTVGMNAGDAQVIYNIALGPAPGGVGYGIGDYGDGSYGLGVVVPEQTGTPITATDWSLDNWGELLLASPKNGGIYTWSPLGGFENAQMIGTAPAFNGGIFVSMPAQILVAWGTCSSGQIVGVDQDPLLIRWSNILDYSDWSISTTSYAGEHRISNGSRIVGAMQGPQYGLIWTDLDLWSMNFIGQGGVAFGFNKIGSSCGLIASNAKGQLGSTIFWMGRSNFFALTSGGATPLPCSVWDAVFQNLDTDNLHKCWCWPNTPFNEVWWFYPSTDGDGECDSYVKLDIIEGAWDYGSMRRVCGIDQSVLGMPISATNNGIIYQHEMGYDNDGGPINASFRTGYFKLNEGEQIAFVDWWIPDMRWNTFSNSQPSAQLTVKFYSVMYPGDTNVRTYGPYTLTSSTRFINPRIRGRYVALEIASNDVGSFWRIGLNTFRVAQDGRQ